MLHNRNRGAGIVTVVAVLAVCGILLAGVLGFSYRQYKLAMQEESSDTAFAEIDLCAQLLLRHLNSGITGMDDEGSVFNSFYAFETSEQDKTSVVMCEDDKTCTIWLADGAFLLLQQDEEETIEKYTISYCSDGTMVASSDYYFRYENGIFIIADPPPETEVTSP